jgi:hypothetical protein
MMARESVDKKTKCEYGFEILTLLPFDIVSCEFFFEERLEVEFEIT